ncbi:VOC family protein [Floricoccus penangensis]|uniref:VOC family protein n=1 Tax=Floricoccus penangensis TaxID=1859475 RepID=UPI00203EC069|nr:VOC family protein [Floricoccus penangensis]URZ87577.1 VOC family protein [Floricoccus penangensis]
MATMIFVNFPVKDLTASTGFYKKLGFTLNEEFSNDQASAMVWDENFYIMLLRHEFYQAFIGERTIADNHATSGALIAFSMNSAEEVKEFGRIAEENGGNVYRIDHGIPEDIMFGLEVQDLDGNNLEPNWMAQ